MLSNDFYIGIAWSISAIDIMMRAKVDKETDILIKKSSGAEHVRHVCHTADIPSTYISIKNTCPKKDVFQREHARHICHAAHIPSTYISIKSTGLTEHG